MEYNYSYSCPCLDRKSCSYFSDFRSFLFNKGYISIESKDYCDLYHRLIEDKISINLNEVWAQDFDFRSQYVMDFESIKFCYDSIYFNNKVDYFDSRELINQPIYTFLGKQIDPKTIERVCAKARVDAVAEFAMLHLVFYEAD